MTNKMKKAPSGEHQSPGPSGKTGTAMKWVGGATAILSLIFGIYQLTNLVSGYRERHRRTAELLAAGKLQQGGRDFSSAWTTFEEAAHILNEDPEVRTARENLAMAWLEDVHLGGRQETFTDIANKVTPVLIVGTTKANGSRIIVGTTKANGSRKADLLAHLGWADFLRTRDGVAGLDPEQRYRQSLEVDPHNPYAHAMWGHWILWNRGKIEDARTHFAGALAGTRGRDYVRTLQLAALWNVQSEEPELELIRVANDMRQKNENIDSATRENIWFIYYSHFIADPGGASIERLISALPPAEQLATFRWLFGGADFDDSKRLSRDYYLAMLEEAAGQRAEALRTFQAVRLKLPTNATWWMRKGIDAGIKRLSAAPRT
ncbi:MAG: hypothetical protein LAO31_19755 [Acidobacteriia bacterium]|nr:hypothetical protein [Terriglobia bacterium]